MRVLTFILSILFISSWSSTSNASDKELYDPAPPADAAFVRIIDTTANTAKPAYKSAIINGKTFEIKETEITISPYQIVLAGEHSINAGNSIADKISIEAGKYYTIAINGNPQGQKTKVFDDMLMENPAKCYLYFYNLSSAPTASLFSPKHKANIVADVVSNDSGARAVNALTLDLSVLSSDKTVETFASTELVRKTGITIVLSGSDDNYKAILTKNDVKK